MENAAESAPPRDLRLRPFIEPLLYEKKLSLKEITFVPR